MEFAWTMEFPRQEYWSGLPFLLQGIFPTQGLNPYLLHWKVDSLPLSHQGSREVFSQRPKLDHNDAWVPKNWCFQTVVLEKSLECPDCKEIKPVNLKGNQPWIFIEDMLKLKLQYFGHLVWRADSLEKILILGKIKARGKEGGRGWDGWMASQTQGTWIWANSRR